MSQSQDGGSDEPRQTEQGLYEDRNRENEQVQMIAESFLTERIVVRFDVVSFRKTPTFNLNSFRLMITAVIC